MPNLYNNDDILPVTIPNYEYVSLYIYNEITKDNESTL